MNTAHDLLQQARAAGYILTPKDGGLINIRPRPTDELREAVKAHKAELLALLSSSPANDPTPSPSRGEVQPRAPLVSLDDLHQVQRELLPHLATCRDCCIEGHLYCTQAERTGNGYAAYLTEFPDAGQRHADYVAVVIQARIRGLQAGFRALDVLTSPNPETWLETARSLIAGPAAVAFTSHVQVCAFCRPRSGEYCGEGRGLHQEARREGVQ